jgi:GAF domain-containing protein
MSPVNSDLAVRMAELARNIARPRTAEQILKDVAAAAVELIPGVHTAGILLVKGRGEFDSVGPTSDIPHQLDELQMRFGEGPCLQAALEDTIVRTDDFRDEQRWPKYSPAVVELGILSGLSFKLFTGDRTAGALNLFGHEPVTWDVDAETTGSVLAAHAAAALVAHRQEIELQTALLSRDRIGQAKGIIMERYHIDDVRAFEMLRRLSQESNTKLTELADRVIATIDD